MANILFQWLMMAAFTTIQPANISIQNYFTNCTTNKVALQNTSGICNMAEVKNHPLYISVININHNAKDKVLEVSVRIFTDDFENTLKKYSTTKIDLTHPADKALADKLVSNYLLNKLQIKADNKSTTLHYVGFEQQQESIWIYFEVPNIASVKKIEVNTNILYDYQEKQINIIHAKVNGDEKSFRLDNPKSYAAFVW